MHRSSIQVVYRNYRGEVATRDISPEYVWYGVTDWHPKEGYLLHAYDHEKQAYRDFALADCDFVSANQEPTAPHAHDLAMMLHQRGERVAPASGEPVAWVWLASNGRVRSASNNAPDQEHVDYATADGDRIVPVYAHPPAPMAVEAADHPAISIGNIGNYYGGLILKREGGIDYWAIENWNGDDWKECDHRVATALRALSYPVRSRDG